jgi:hypothetical protein
MAVSSYGRFRRSTTACHVFDTLVKGRKSRRDAAMTTPRAAAAPARGRRADRRTIGASVPRYRGGLIASAAVRRTALHGAQHSSCQPTTRPQSGQRCW